MYLDRLLLLYQRLRRDRVFSKPALADADGEARDKSYCQVPLFIFVRCTKWFFTFHTDLQGVTITYSMMVHKLSEVTGKRQGWLMTSTMHT